MHTNKQTHMHNTNTFIGQEKRAPPPPPPPVIGREHVHANKQTGLKKGNGHHDEEERDRNLDDTRWGTNWMHNNEERDLLHSLVSRWQGQRCTSHPTWLHNSSTYSSDVVETGSPIGNIHADDEKIEIFLFQWTASWAKVSKLYSDIAELLTVAIFPSEISFTLRVCFLDKAHTQATYSSTNSMGLAACSFPPQL